jgi:hypothetical protein
MCIYPLHAYPSTTLKVIFQYILITFHRKECRFLRSSAMQTSCFSNGLFSNLFRDLVTQHISGRGKTESGMAPLDYFPPSALQKPLKQSARHGATQRSLRSFLKRRIYLTIMYGLSFDQTSLNEFLKSSPIIDTILSP